MCAPLREAAAGIWVSRGCYNRLQNKDDYMVQPLLVYLRHKYLPGFALFPYDFRLALFRLICQLRVFHRNVWRLRILYHAPHGGDFVIKIGVYLLYLYSLRFALPQLLVCFSYYVFVKHTAIQIFVLFNASFRCGFFYFLPQLLLPHKQYSYKNIFSSILYARQVRPLYRAPCIKLIYHLPFQ